MEIIDSDLETTWPEALRTALAGMEAQLRSFHVERARLDKAAQEDVLLRVHRPRNPHQAFWNDAISLADSVIANSLLLGFHATKLTENEREIIEGDGLAVLSQALFEERIGSLADALTDHDRRKLRSRHQILDGNRAGKIWFCFSRSMLCDEWGMRRFFENWGGEALYNSHEDDPKTGRLLKRIGEPCIVEAAAPISEIETFMSVGERLVNVWAARRGISTGHDAQFEGYSRAHVREVLRIIRFNDPEFIALTRHDDWRKPLEGPKS